RMSLREAKPIMYRGKEYESLRAASKDIGLTHSTLAKLIKKNGQKGSKLDKAITAIVIAKDKHWTLAQQKRPTATALTYNGKKYKSLRAAAQDIGLSHSILSKLLREHGSNGPKLDQAIYNLISMQNRLWTKAFTINSEVFYSYIEAGKRFGVRPEIIGDWILEYEDNFEIHEDDILFEELEKGSWKHLVALTHRAGFNSVEDWYRKKRDVPDIINLISWLKKSDITLLDFLNDLYSDTTFEWWRLKQAPEGTLKDNKRIKQYLEWLENKLGYKEPEDWYQINANDFKANYGGSLLAYHPMMDLVKILHPSLLDWLFKVVPDGYWKKLQNQKAVLDYITEQEKFLSLNDWYNVSFKDIFGKYKVQRLVMEYNSAVDCLAANYPDHDFVFWKFTRSRGHWSSKTNQRDYIDWLGNQLGIGHPADWYNVTEQDFIDNHGITLLGQYYSSNIADCIMNILKDEYPWEKIRFYRNQYKREVRLYGIISCGLPDYKVQFRYKHPEIRHPNSGRKVEYDVFIEEIDAAIEYQGEQHYRPIDRFDGVDPEEAQKSFEHRQKTDQEKREQSKLNNVDLLEIKYSEWDGSLDYVLDLFNQKFGIKINRETVLTNASARGFVDNEIIFESD
ncbi:hypothetical protein N8914_05905, partial [Planktomarina temperata]|nr:hypothetical protein [Planktomarina temperata]